MERGPLESRSECPNYICMLCKERKDHMENPGISACHAPAITFTRTRSGAQTSFVILGAYKVGKLLGQRWKKRALDIQLEYRYKEIQK